MGTVLGIAGFTLLWAATCLTEASLAEIVLTAMLGLALMIAGRLWTPCMGWIKERMRRQPMPAPAGSNSRPQVSGVRERQTRGGTGCEMCNSLCPLARGIRTPEAILSQGATCPPQEEWTA